MPSFSNPNEIARETFRILATRRIAPTPEHYHTVYHEVAGTNANEAGEFPAEQLKSLVQELPRTTPSQMRLARELEHSLKEANWNNYRDTLTKFIDEQGTVESLPWGELINSLLREWDSNRSGITPGKKREALDHLFSSAGSNAETLHSRLHSLVRAWSQGEEVEEAGLVGGEIPPPESAAGNEAPSAAAAQPTSRASELLPDLRDLLAFALEHAVAAQIAESPELAGQAKELAASARKANSMKAIETLLIELKRFVFRLELLADDRAELRQGLLHLLQLVIENISELVIDDNWLNGQIDIVRDIVTRPLSLRSIDDAERRIKEVIFKQSQLKHSLVEAKEALKNNARRLRRSPGRLRRLHLRLSRQDRNLRQENQRRQRHQSRLARARRSHARNPHHPDQRPALARRTAHHAQAGRGNRTADQRTAGPNSTTPAHWCATTSSPARSTGADWKKPSRKKPRAPIAARPRSVLRCSISTISRSSTTRLATMPATPSADPPRDCYARNHAPPRHPSSAPVVKNSSSCYRIPRLRMRKRLSLDCNAS